MCNTRNHVKHYSVFTYEIYTYISRNEKARQCLYTSGRYIK